MKLTKKAYIEVLNQQCAGGEYRNGLYHNRIRAYGDYLYAQDRDKFNMEFSEWCKAKLNQETAA